MVICTTLNFATMTINQIKKQIATAVKNIAKFKANVDRYMTRQTMPSQRQTKKASPSPPVISTLTTPITNIRM